MKTITRIKIVLVTLISLAILSTATSEGQTPKKLAAVVDIVVEDTAMLHDTHIEFNVAQNEVNTNFSGYTATYKKLLDNKRMRVVIPLSTPISYGKIEITKSNDVLNRSAFMEYNNLFLLQADDTVELHLSGKRAGAYFTGKNADKYTCMYEIGNSSRIRSFSQSNAYMKLNEFEQAFLCEKMQYDSIYNGQVEILNKFKDRLNPEIYELIKLDCWGERNKHIVDIYYATPFKMKRKNEYGKAIELFLKDYGKSAKNVENEDLAAKSYKYADFLIEKELAFAVLTNSGAEKNYLLDLKFADVYKSINQHYQPGPLKDKLRLLALISKYKGYADYIDSAVNNAGTNQFRPALIAFQNSNSFGKAAFAFSLQDTDGNTHRLEDFKGKVLILDFWFTGCQGCLQTAAVLKKIIPFYKKNPNLVFATVSIDINKQTWKKSVVKELYSSNDELNLFAENNRQAPIVKFYQIDSYPTLIVISKNGEVITTSPPDPRNNAERFKDFIDHYL